MILLYVAAGGAIGATCRYLVTGKITHIFGTSFPYGTLTVNVTGSLLMGLLIGYLVKTLPHSMELRAFLAVGILGGFTTFSAFSLDVINLFEDGRLIHAMVYILFSVILSILAIFIGLNLVKSVF